MNNKLEKISEEIKEKQKELEKKIADFDQMNYEFVRDFPVLCYKPRTIRTKRCSKKGNK